MIRVLDVVGLASFGGTLAARCECRVPEDVRTKAESSPLFLATHVRGAGGELLIHDGPRSLPVESDGEVLVPLVIPAEPGRYRVEVDPVVEGKFWGSSIGLAPAAFEVDRAPSRDLSCAIPGRAEPVRLATSGGAFRIPHPRYGLGDSERAVEIPWVLSRYRGERTVVDVGSANAEPRYLEALAALRIPALIALDLVPVKGLPGHGVVADVRRPPLKPGSVDLVLAISVIEHVGRDNTVYVGHGKGPQDRDGDLASVRALGDLLHPGGRLLITVPFGRFQDHGWFIQYDRARLDTLVERSGLRCTELELFEYAEGWRGPVEPPALAGRGYREEAIAAGGLACLALSRQ